MWHPSEAVPVGKRISVFLPLLVLTLVVMGALAAMDRPLKTQAALRGIVSFELAGDVQAARRVLNCWDEVARISAAFSLGLDFLFLCAYSTTIGFACVWAAGVFRAYGWPLSSAGVLLAWGQWLAALLDATENFALLILLRGAVEEPWPRIAWWCAVPKFVLIVTGLSYAALYGCPVYCVERLRRRTQP